MVPVRADVLQAAAQLVADSGERVEQAERRGRAEGLRDGVAAGYAEGYRDGFEAGLDVGACRVLIHGPIPDLSPQYGAWRRRLDAGPCPDPRCVPCSVRRGWLERYGSEFRGTGT